MMNHRLFGFLFAVTVATFGVQAEDLTRSEAPENIPLSSAIFVMNRAGPEYDAKLDVLNDMITTRLTEKGFRIVDKNEALGKFREYREIDREDPKRDEVKVADIVGKLLGVEGSDNSAGVKSLDELVDSYSAKKIANMLRVDYVIIATINSVGRETRKGEAYGQKMGSVTTTMRVAVKVLEGNQAGSVAGTIVEASDRIPLMDGLQIENTDLDNKLLNTCAEKVAEVLGEKTEQIRNVVVTAPAMVQISVASNIEGAEVSLDGIMYGTTPCKIMVPQGPAALKITKEWFKPVEKFLNPVQGQALNISLELSNEGIKQWKDVESFKQAMAKAEQDAELEKVEREAQVEISKQQSEADAYATKQVAEGEKKKREQSYIHDDGFGDKLKEVIHGN